MHDFSLLVERVNGTCPVCKQARDCLEDYISLMDLYTTTFSSTPEKLVHFQKNFFFPVSEAREKNGIPYKICFCYSS